MDREHDVIQNGGAAGTEPRVRSRLASTQNGKKRRGRPRKAKPKEASGEYLTQQGTDSQDTDKDTDPVLEVWCCKSCNIEFSNDDDKLMQCERCDGATCIKCLNMDSSMYEMLKGRLDVHWYCPACDKQAMTAVRSDWEIEEKCAAYMASVTERLDTMQCSIDLKADKATVDKLNVDVKSTQKLVEGANADIAYLSDRIELMRNEPAEIEKLRKNIVVRGLPEIDASANHGKLSSQSQSDCVSDSEGQAQPTPDERTCKQLFNSIGIDVTPKSVHRLGKKKTDGTPRPVKVILQNEEDKKRVLRNGPHVRNIDPDKVSFNPSKVCISPDMTILQREEDFKLRDELRRKRLVDPNWIIKGKKLFLRTSLTRQPKPDPPRSQGGVAGK